MKHGLSQLVPTIEAEYLERLVKDGTKWTLKEAKSNLSHPSYIEITKYFVESGAQAIQLILGKTELHNLSEIRRIYPDLTIISGGGIRSIDTALNYIEKGADYVVIGSHLSQNPEELQKYIDALENHLIVSVDDIEGVLATNNNVETLDYCEYLSKHHVANVIYVNESTKLKNQGISTDRFKNVCSIIPSANIIYSGGISSKKDILELISLGADNMILGTYAYNHSECLEK